MFARIAFRIIVGLVILGLLVGGAFMVYRMGTFQGYQAGLQASGNTTSQAAPAVPYGFYPRGLYYYPPFFSPFGFIVPILGILFVIFLVTLPFRMMMRRRFFGRHMMASGPEYEAWMKEHGEHFRHMHGYWSWHDQPGAEHKGDQPNEQNKV